MGYDGYKGVVADQNLTYKEDSVNITMINDKSSLRQPYILFNLRQSI